MTYKQFAAKIKNDEAFKMRAKIAREAQNALKDVASPADLAAGSKVCLAQPRESAGTKTMLGVRLSRKGELIQGKSTSLKVGDATFTAKQLGLESTYVEMPDCGFGQEMKGWLIGSSGEQNMQVEVFYQTAAGDGEGTPNDHPTMDHVGALRPRPPPKPPPESIVVIAAQTAKAVATPKAPVQAKPEGPEVGHGDAAAEKAAEDPDERSAKRQRLEPLQEADADGSTGVDWVQQPLGVLGFGADLPDSTELPTWWGSVAAAHRHIEEEYNRGFEAYFSARVAWRAFADAMRAAGQDEELTIAEGLYKEMWETRVDQAVESKQQALDGALIRDVSVLAVNSLMSESAVHRTSVSEASVLDVLQGKAPTMGDLVARAARTDKKRLSRRTGGTGDGAIDLEGDNDAQESHEHGVEQRLGLSKKAKVEHELGQDSECQLEKATPSFVEVILHESEVLHCSVLPDEDNEPLPDDGDGDDAVSVTSKVTVATTAGRRSTGTGSGKKLRRRPPNYWIEKLSLRSATQHGYDKRDSMRAEESKVKEATGPLSGDADRLGQHLSNVYQLAKLQKALVVDEPDVDTIARMRLAGRLGLDLLPDTLVGVCMRAARTCSREIIGTDTLNDEFIKRLCCISLPWAAEGVTFKVGEPSIGTLWPLLPSPMISEAVVKWLIDDTLAPAVCSYDAQVNHARLVGIATAIDAAFEDIPADIAVSKPILHVVDSVTTSARAIIVVLNPSISNDTMPEYFDDVITVDKQSNRAAPTVACNVGLKTKANQQLALRFEDFATKGTMWRQKAPEIKRALATIQQLPTTDLDGATTAIAALADLHGKYANVLPDNTFENAIAAAIRLVKGIHESISAVSDGVATLQRASKLFMDVGLLAPLNVDMDTLVHDARQRAQLAAAKQQASNMQARFEDMVATWGDTTCDIDAFVAILQQQGQVPTTQGGAKIADLANDLMLKASIELWVENASEDKFTSCFALCSALHRYLSKAAAAENVLLCEWAKSTRKLSEKLEYLSKATEQSERNWPEEERLLIALAHSQRSLVTKTSGKSLSAPLAVINLMTNVSRFLEKLSTEHIDRLREKHEPLVKKTKEYTYFDRPYYDGVDVDGDCWEEFVEKSNNALMRLDSSSIDSRVEELKRATMQLDNIQHALQSKDGQWKDISDVITHAISINCQLKFMAKVKSSEKTEWRSAAFSCVTELQQHGISKESLPKIVLRRLTNAMKMKGGLAAKARRLSCVSASDLCVLVFAALAARREFHSIGQVVKKKVKGGGAKKEKQKAKGGKEEPRNSFFRVFFKSFKEDGPVPDDIDLEAMGLGEEDDDDDQQIMEMIMDNDHDMGCAVRDNIIPYAVRWYTGEAAPDMDDDDEDEEEEMDEDDEEEDDEEDDDDDEDEVPKKGGKKDPKGSAGPKKKGGGADGAGAAAAGGEAGKEDCKQQ
ncbi:unnamed protein product [Prorocentrum cordatum]|uniref:Uncharacterized protein n=1 Tax=Prorocentrum cordatum TaxID=2364126 RepID=A0ABN9TCF4_9DINO|nr:unnamed protein product [Polarella glacialis]